MRRSKRYVLLSLSLVSVVAAAVGWRFVQGGMQATTPPSTSGSMEKTHNVPPPLDETGAIVDTDADSIQTPPAADKRDSSDEDSGAAMTSTPPPTAPASTDPPQPLSPPSARVAKATGIVNINAVPWADVSIDGVAYTTTPILGLSLKVGKHKAVFVNPELGITKTRTFIVKADAPTMVLVEME